LDRKHAQSAVFVLVASVTGVLGAGEEVAVDFGLEDGGDEVDLGLLVVVVDGGSVGDVVAATGVEGGVVVAARRSDGVEVEPGGVTDARGVVTLVPAFGFGVALLVVVDAPAWTGVIRRSRGAALFAAAVPEEAEFIGLPSVRASATFNPSRRLKGVDSFGAGLRGPVTWLPSVLTAAALVPDNDGWTIARDAISAAVVLPSVLAPGVDAKPAARNSRARTASVRARRGRTHSLPPSVASQSR
jgi:hypothetical protein